MLCQGFAHSSSQQNFTVRVASLRESQMPFFFALAYELRFAVPCVSAQAVFTLARYTQSEIEELEGNGRFAQLRSKRRLKG